MMLFALSPKRILKVRLIFFLTVPISARVLTPYWHNLRFKIVKSSGGSSYLQFYRKFSLTS